MAASLEISLLRKELCRMIPTPEEAWTSLGEYDRGERHQKHGRMEQVPCAVDERIGLIGAAA